MSQYGLIPVYPLRENVYVGDIYLIVHNPCEGSTTKLMQSVLLGSIPEDQIADAFDTFYKSRPELPATSAKTASPPTNKPSKVPATPSPGKITITGITAMGPGTATVTPAPGGASSGTTGSTAGTGGAGAAGTPTSASAAGITPQPAAGADDPIFEPKGKSRTPFNRLRLASFPDFTLGSSYTFEGGGGGIIGGFNAALGIGRRQTSHLKVSVSGVEEAVIPAPAYMRAVRAFLASPNVTDVLDNYTVTRLQDTLEAQMEQEPDCKNPSLGKSSIIFVDRVFYTRTVTFDFGQNDVLAVLIKATAASPGQAATAGGANASSSSAGSSGSGSSTTATAVDQNEAAVAAMQKEIAALAGPGPPGGSLSLGIGTSGSVALKQTFDRPMAFGMDHTVGVLWEEILDARSQ
jgi:hypothetical protein